MPEKNQLPQIDLQSLIQGGISLLTSTLFLDGEITPNLASYLTRALHALALNKQPITIFLNTPGGECTAAFGMYDIIRACPEHVTIVGYGEVASAGVLILQAGDFRALTKNCQVLVHPGVSSVSENMHQNVLSNVKANSKMGSMFYGVIGKAMGLSVKEMHDRYTWDVWMSAQRAVKLGLADKVIY